MNRYVWVARDVSFTPIAQDGWRVVALFRADGDEWLEVIPLAGWMLQVQVCLNAVTGEPAIEQPPNPERTVSPAIWCDDGFLDAWPFVSITNGVCRVVGPGQPDPSKAALSADLTSKEMNQ